MSATRTSERGARAVGPDARTLAERLTAAIVEEDVNLAARLEHDPGAFLDLIRLAALAEDHSAATLRDAVAGARSAGNTWEAIGQALGMSRQAAQQRFGEQTPAPSGAETRILKGLNAFNEMAVLQEAGRSGWHSIGYGPLYHVLERTDRQWEHLRLFMPGGDVEALKRGGWQQIGSGWFPWAYFKRQLQVSAVAEL